MTFRANYLGERKKAKLKAGNSENKTNVKCAGKIKINNKSSHVNELLAHL